MCPPLFAAIAAAPMASAVIGTTIIGAGISIAGQQQAAQAAKQRAAYRNAILRNQQATLARDIQGEKDNQGLRLQLIGEAGKQREGEFRVAQAAQGQLVDVGSAADTTADLAGEVAFKKLISNRDSANVIRNLQIQTGNLEGAIGLEKFGAQQASTAASFASFGTAFKTGAGLFSTFEGDGKGGIRFRSRG